MNAFFVTLALCTLLQLAVVLLAVRKWYQRAQPRSIREHLGALAALVFSGLSTGVFALAWLGMSRSSLAEPVIRWLFAGHPWIAWGYCCLLRLWLVFGAHSGARGTRALSWFFVLQMVCSLFAWFIVAFGFMAPSP